MFCTKPGQYKRFSLSVFKRKNHMVIAFIDEDHEK